MLVAHIAQTVGLLCTTSVPDITSAGGSTVHLCTGRTEAVVRPCALSVPGIANAGGMLRDVGTGYCVTDYFLLYLWNARRSCLSSSALVVA